MHMRHVDRSVDTPYAAVSLTETDGAGSPIVLLHGGGADRHVFDAQLHSRLGERHHLVALDLPGHGESSNASDPQVAYTLPGFAATVAFALDRLNIARATVFGWSLGGHVGVELLAIRPDLVSGLMLTGAPPIGRGPLAVLRGFHASWDMLLASKANFNNHDIERYATLCYGPGAPASLHNAILRTDGRARAIFARSLMQGQGSDQRHVVQHAQVPVAIVNGEHDPLVRLSYFDTLERSHLWNGSQHVLAGAGHAAFRDKPERFNALLMRFAADCEALADSATRPAALRA